MNLFQRINEVRKAIDYIRKDKSVSTGGGSYKAVTHDMVTAMVRDHMVKHGIVSYPVLVESQSMPFEVDKEMNRSKQFLYDATYDFHFVNADEPKDELVVRIQAHAMDNADKAPGKALSYAKKYAVLKVFEIETGEDEESRAATNEFPIDEYLTEIGNAPDLDSLKKAYAKAFSAAGDIRDKDSQAAIIKAKDARKEALAGVAA